MATNRTLTEANVRNADVITVLLGVNDFNWAVKDGFWRGQPGYYDESHTYYQLGDSFSNDTSTFYGALHAWCKEIVRIKQLEGFENKQFVVMTPLITSWNVSMTSGKDWNQNKVNVHGHTLRQQCTAILEVCTYYDIPVFDSNMYSGVYYKSPTDNNVTETGGDGVHINEKGHALLAEALEEFLLEGYSYESRTVADCGHRFERVVTAPTCTEKGFTTYRCPDCHYSDTGEETAPLGHRYSGNVCTVCGNLDGGYRVEAPGEEVWVDGVQQTVYRNDSGTFVVLENTDAKIMTVYSYNDAGAEDPHTKYPTGMQVWRLRFENGAYTAEPMPEWENLLQYAGASIRVTGIKGIRMITALDKGLRSSLLVGTSGYTLVEYGTCVAWAEDRTAPVLGDRKTMHNYAYRKDTADPIFADTGDAVQFTNVLVGFTDDQLNKDLVLRPYILLEDEAGQQLTVYGGCVRRSIGYIAKQNQNTFPAGTKADSYIEDIIAKVYG